MTPLLDQTAAYRRPDGVVGVRGPDRLAYLHLMLSQSVEGLSHHAADFLYLDPKGNALAAGRAVVNGEQVVLVTPAPVAADLAAALEKFKFLMQVDAADWTSRWAVASVRGPGRVDLAGAPAEPMRVTAVGEGLLVRDRDGGVDVVGPRDWVAERIAGLPNATPDEWEAYRIAAGLPRWGAEIVPGRRPQELGLLPTRVHLRKRCYPVHA